MNLKNLSRLSRKGPFPGRFYIITIRFVVHLKDVIRSLAQRPFSGRSSPSSRWKKILVIFGRWFWLTQLLSAHVWSLVLKLHFLLLQIIYLDAVLSSLEMERVPAIVQLEMQVILDTFLFLCCWLSRLKYFRKDLTIIQALMVKWRWSGKDDFLV